MGVYMGIIPESDSLALIFDLLRFEPTLWDLVLVCVVTAQALSVAYSESPKWKGLFLSLPTPYTVIALSVDRPIDASNVLSILVLLAYALSICLLHKRLRVPIGLAIATGLILYIVVGWLCSTIVPSTDIAFGLACATTIPTGLLLHRLFASTAETPHRTTLPVSLKLPIVLAVVALLISIKYALAGFAAMFPLVSVVGAYELRYSLWTLVRTVPVLMVALPLMLIVTRFTQSSIGLGWGLALGWLVFIPVLFWMRRDVQ